jgi:hypothetical protein
MKQISIAVEAVMQLVQTRCGVPLPVIALAKFALTVPAVLLLAQMASSMVTRQAQTVEVAALHALMAAHA